MGLDAPCAGPEHAVFRVGNSSLSLSTVDFVSDMLLLLRHHLSGGAELPQALSPLVAGAPSVTSVALLRSTRGASADASACGPAAADDAGPSASIASLPPGEASASASSSPEAASSSAPCASLPLVGASPSASLDASTRSCGASAGLHASPLEPLCSSSSGAAVGSASAGASSPALIDLESPAAAAAVPTRAVGAFDLLVYRLPTVSAEVARMSDRLFSQRDLRSIAFHSGSLVDACGLSWDDAVSFVLPRGRRRQFPFHLSVSAGQAAVRCVCCHRGMEFVGLSGSVPLYSFGPRCSYRSHTRTFGRLGARAIGGAPIFD